MAALKTLRSTFVYQNFNKEVNLDKRALTLISSGTTVNNRIEEFLVRFAKYKHPGSFEMVDAVRSGKLTVIYSKLEDANLPNIMPAFVTGSKTPGMVNVYVNISRYTSSITDDAVKINETALYSLLMSGYILLKSYTNWNKITYSQSIRRYGSAAYSSIMLKLFNKNFAININPTKQDKIIYIFSKFYLINVLGMDPNVDSQRDIIENLSLGNISKTSSKMIELFAHDISNDAFASIDALITTISEKIEGFETLNIKNFMESFMLMYGTGTPLMIEYFPAFITQIGIVIVGSNLNNMYAFESAIKLDGDKLYAEFMKL